MALEASERASQLNVVNKKQKLIGLVNGSDLWIHQADGTGGFLKQPLFSVKATRAWLTLAVQALSHGLTSLRRVNSVLNRIRLQLRPE